jgi:two-component sensor histidine kinase
MLIPSGRDDDELAILASLRRGEHVDHYETVSLRKDGSLLDISLTVSPIKNGQGKIIGASKIARDITERKRSDAHIALLGREAEHRTANILATVQAIVALSQAATIDDFKVAIEARIRALAGVHSLFVESRWAGADLSSIVTQELAPYLGTGEARAQMDGPNVLLSTNAAQAMAMTLHELATNAAKYGSLSVPEGHVCVRWALLADGLVTLRWTENGGPPTKEPTREGFGMSVIKRMIQQEGKIHFAWRSEGFACEIVLNI